MLKRYNNLKYLILIYPIIAMFVGCATDKAASKVAIENHVGTLKDLAVFNKNNDVYLEFVSDQPVEYNSFMVMDPLRLVIDMPDLDAQNIKRRIGIHRGGILQVVKRRMNAENYARFEVHLMYPRPYEIKKENNKLVVRFLPPMDSGTGVFDMNAPYKNKIASGKNNSETNGRGEIDKGIISDDNQEVTSKSLPLISSVNSNREKPEGGESSSNYTSLNLSENEANTSDSQSMSHQKGFSLREMKRGTQPSSGSEVTNGTNNDSDTRVFSNSNATSQSGSREMKVAAGSLNGFESKRSSTSLNASNNSKNANKPSSDSNVSLPGNYRIGASDVLAILVWNNEALSSEVIVRPDGMITLPLLGDFVASGKTPIELRGEIVVKLTDYQEVPEVSVIVRQINSYIIYVLGEVMQPGPYTLSRDTTLLQAVTLSGGFTQFAAKNNIIVLRNENGIEKRFKIKYKDIISGEKLDKNIKLHSGDTIIIP